MPGGNMYHQYEENRYNQAHNALGAVENLRSPGI
jgi:hypothetical protein